LEKEGAGKSKFHDVSKSGLGKGWGFSLRGISEHDTILDPSAKEVPLVWGKQSISKNKGRFVREEIDIRHLRRRGQNGPNKRPPQRDRCCSLGRQKIKSYDPEKVRWGEENR